MIGEAHDYGMIEIDRRAGNEITVRLRGAQDTDEFLALATVLVAKRSGSPRLQVLFDWSELESWDFKQPSGLKLRAWTEAARSLECVAILHHRRWNRQAAWFAAVLRAGKAQVRSYWVPDREGAMTWLRGCAEARMET